MPRRPQTPEDASERWILNTFLGWFFLLAWYTGAYGQDQLAMAGFFLWTAVALLVVLILMCLFSR